MKKYSLISIILIIAIVFSSCATSKTIPLTQEQLEKLIPLNQEIVENTVTIEKEVPVESPYYVFIKDNQDGKSGVLTQEELLKSVNEGNIVDTTSLTSTFGNTIVEYYFEDGKIYDVLTSINEVTDIRLQPGEEISGDAALGDSSQWLLTTSSTTENGKSVIHIFIKPTAAGLSTSLIIPTNYRSYYIRLRSSEDLNMIGVRWKYPEFKTFSSPSFSSTTTETTTSSVNIENINWDYSISGDNKIWWKPISVFDDGDKTYIQFDPRFSSSSGAPTMYLLPKNTSSNKEAETLNYRTKGNLYIIDGIIDKTQGLLLMSEKQTVKITRK